jgi:hypothetical protein
MRFLPAIANVLWGATSLGAWQRYRHALSDPAAAQERLLFQYLGHNANTVVGRAYGFDSIKSVEEYQTRVPISTFDSIETLVQRGARGEAGVLTHQPVSRLVPSSGSTAAVKLIPYTRRLQQEFSEAVDAWIADLYIRHPRLIAGPAYWSITPATGNDRPFVMQTSNIPVGFDDDSSYLGGVRGALARASMAVPPAVRLNHDLASFRRATLRHLLLARDLRLVSVWHPSFLSMLIDTLSNEWAALLDDVASIDAARAEELRTLTPEGSAAIWPKLALVSCWGDGPARSYATELASRLRGIQLQPKGLLATEGVVTIPFQGRHPIAINSHFFEFVPLDGGARERAPRLAHQLQPGVEYSVVMTTGGGLYRYHLADRVTVDGVVERTPSLTFVGKDDRVSDRFGEKLSDGFVARVLDRIFAAPRSRPRFAMLAPEELPAGVCYTLFMEDVNTPSAELAGRLEAELRVNPHYAWCVDVGQLRPARIVRVGPGADRAYLDFCVAQGQRLGDIKPVSLHPTAGWGDVLPC